MPELPEVETVKRGLNRILRQQDCRIDSVKTSNKSLRFQWPKSFRKTLSGESILGVNRRAKYLIFKTTGMPFLCHLGMTGSWREELVDSPNKPHDHLFLNLNSGNRLVYNDPRRFGYFDLLPEKNLDDSHWFSHLGPEPLNSKDFHAKYLFAKSRKKQSSVKAFLMDQKTVVGVGNIYASEALFASKILPNKKAGRLTQKQCDILVKSIQNILDMAIRSGGSTIRDFRSAGGSEGYFQQKLSVYGRDGDPCIRCRKAIRKSVITGRSTYWCSSCQK